MSGPTGLCFKQGKTALVVAGVFFGVALIALGFVKRPPPTGNPKLSDKRINGSHPELTTTTTTTTTTRRTTARVESGSQWRLGDDDNESSSDRPYEERDSWFDDSYPLPREPRSGNGQSRAKRDLLNKRLGDQHEKIYVSGAVFYDDDQIDSIVQQHLNGIEGGQLDDNEIQELLGNGNDNTEDNVVVHRGLQDDPEMQEETPSTKQDSVTSGVEDALTDATTQDDRNDLDEITIETFEQTAQEKVEATEKAVTQAASTSEQTVPQITEKLEAPLQNSVAQENESKTRRKLEVTTTKVYYKSTTEEIPEDKFSRESVQNVPMKWEVETEGYEELSKPPEIPLSQTITEKPADKGGESSGFAQGIREPEAVLSPQVSENKINELADAIDESQNRHETKEIGSTSRTVSMVSNAPEVGPTEEEHILFSDDSAAKKPKGLTMSGRGFNSELDTNTENYFADVQPPTELFSPSSTQQATEVPETSSTTTTKRPTTIKTVKTTTTKAASIPEVTDPVPFQEVTTPAQIPVPVKARMKTVKLQQATTRSSAKFVPPPHKTSAPAPANSVESEKTENKYSVNRAKSLPDHDNLREAALEHDKLMESLRGRGPARQRFSGHSFFQNDHISPGPQSKPLVQWEPVGMGSPNFMPSMQHYQLRPVRNFGNPPIGFPFG